MGHVRNPHLDVSSAAVTGNKTLAAADSGVAQVVTATATVTLPAVGSTTVGQVAHVVCGAQGSKAGTVNINVSPNSADKIMGLGFTAADDKDAILTAGRYGDFIKLVSDGLNGWFV